MIALVVSILVYLHIIVIDFSLFSTTGIKHLNPKELKLYNIERKFRVISSLASNSECLGFILEGLNRYFTNILHYLETNDEQSLRHVCSLLKTILNVSYIFLGFLPDNFKNRRSTSTNQ